jgi:hypothetical protein
MRMCQEVRVSRRTKKPLAKKQPVYGISNSQPQKDRRAKKSCFYLLGEVLYLKGTYVVYIYINVTSLKPELGSEVITERFLESVVPRTLHLDHFRWLPFVLQ